MPGRMPEDMPDRMPEDMPDKMPEAMSNRMPEDLPVTKRIDVMVGITRSKVIWICLILPCHPWMPRSGQKQTKTCVHCKTLAIWILHKGRPWQGTPRHEVDQLPAASFGEKICARSIWRQSNWLLQSWHHLLRTAMWKIISMIADSSVGQHEGLSIGIQIDRWPRSWWQCQRSGVHGLTGSFNPGPHHTDSDRGTFWLPALGSGFSFLSKAMARHHMTR